MAWRFQLGYKMCMNPSLRNRIELNCNLVVAFGHLMCNVQSFHQNEYSHGAPPHPLAVTTVKLRNDMDFQGFISLVEMESVRPTDLNLPLALPSSLAKGLGEVVAQQCSTNLRGQ